MLGGIALQKEPRKPEQNLNFSVLSELARSADAKRLMAMLQQQGEVHAAAEAAAAGDPAKLMELMNGMLQTKDGADLVDRIGKQAKQAGLY